MIVFLTTILVLLCLLVVLLIMIQRTSGGMGSALGGGTADQVLGAGSAAQLSKFTVYGILGFFVLSFVLYAFYQNEAESSQEVFRQGVAPAVQSDSVQPVDLEVPPLEELSSPPAPAPDVVEAPVPVVPGSPKKAESNQSE
jgi:protein translocase SecG subunit